MTNNKKINNISLIAHRLGYKMTMFPENSIAAINEIFSQKHLLDSCSGFEFDICFTKDNIPVVIHDKHIDDISNDKGIIRKYTLSDLKKINFTFRKNENTSKKYFFKIVTLDELLNFFSRNKTYLKNKIIKIETKEAAWINKSSLEELALILNKYHNLRKNIIHLSFWPQNLKHLKNIQKKNHYYLSETDLLCDFKIIVVFSKYMNWLDNISLRIKTRKYSIVSKQNTFRTNLQIIQENFCMYFTTAVNEKNINYAINRFGKVGVYVINDNYDLDIFINAIGEDFFIKNQKNIWITSNNPYKLISSFRTL